MGAAASKTPGTPISDRKNALLAVKSGSCSSGAKIAALQKNMAADAALRKARSALNGRLALKTPARLIIPTVRYSSSPI